VKVLVARCDNAGDVLLTGPAVRALTAAGCTVSMLVSPRGAEAARVLPGVQEVIVTELPWIDPEPAAVRSAEVAALVAQLSRRVFSAAAILVSWHQSPLPLALLLRLAGVPCIAAVSHDYAGSLLDHRVPVDPGGHEVERNLAVASALGGRLPPDDDGRLRIEVASVTGADLPDPPYVVLHPGASVPARTLSAPRWSGIAHAIAAAGHHLVVTGGPSERALVEAVVRDAGERTITELAGETTIAELGILLSRARVLICGNTGPMHLAAAVGTPVVAAFPPTVSPSCWRPWRVPSVLLGAHDVPCARCRARVCPVEGQPCLAGVGPREVLAAIEQVLGAAA